MRQARATTPCREHGPDLWFAQDPVEEQLAKSLCRPCPVLAECLAGAVKRAEPWGVWGGELFIAGVIVARRPRRGRPPKRRVAA